MIESLDIDHLKTWIGREEAAHDVVTPALVHKFRATLGLGESTAEIAPRLIHFCLAQPIVPLDGAGPDGHPKRGGFLPPVPLPRRMWRAARSRSTATFIWVIPSGAPRASPP